jgi:hypothetical protein
MVLVTRVNNRNGCGVYRVPQIAEAYKNSHYVREALAVQSQRIAIISFFDLELLIKNDFDYL